MINNILQKCNKLPDQIAFFIHPFSNSALTLSKDKRRAFMHSALWDLHL